MTVYRSGNSGPDDCNGGSSGVSVLSLGMEKLGSLFIFLTVTYAVAVAMAIFEVFNGRGLTAAKAKMRSRSRTL